MNLKNEMIESIKNEIKFQKDFINPNETIETIYFGGGTPSLLNAEELNSILEVIHQKVGKWRTAVSAREKLCIVIFYPVRLQAIS